MTTYQVWDKLNETDEEASDVVAYSARAAAERYASLDTDGNIDGAYHGDGVDLCVKLPNGTVETYNVTREDLPSFNARQITP